MSQEEIADTEMEQDSVTAKRHSNGCISVTQESPFSGNQTSMTLSEDEARTLYEWLEVALDE